MRSAIDIASSWSCVTYTNVVPTSRWIWLSSICSRWRSFRSSAPSGSSSSSTAGPLDERARDGDALGLAAGELARACGRRSSSSPTSFSASSTRALRLAPVGTRSMRRPKRTFSRTVMCGKSAYDWKTVLTGRRCGGSPSIALAAEPDLAARRGHEAADQVQRRRLAAARRPEQAEELAVLDAQVERPQRLDAPVALGHAAQARCGRHPRSLGLPPGAAARAADDELDVDAALAVAVAAVERRDEDARGLGAELGGVVGDTGQRRARAVRRSTGRRSTRARGPRAARRRAAAGGEAAERELGAGRDHRGRRLGQAEQGARRRGARPRSTSGAARISSGVDGQSARRSADS